MPGKELVVADTLSRNPLAALPGTSDTQEDVIAYVDAAEMEGPTSPEKIEQIKCATASDPQLRRVLDYTVIADGQSTLKMFQEKYANITPYVVYSR